MQELVWLVKKNRFKSIGALYTAGTFCIIIRTSGVVVETAGFGPGRWLYKVLGSNPDECVNLMFYLSDLSLTLTKLAWASLCSSLCCLHTPYMTLAKWDLADCTCPSSSLTSLTALARLAQVAQALYKLSKYICPFTDVVLNRLRLKWSWQRVGR